MQDLACQSTSYLFPLKRISLFCARRCIQYLRELQNQAASPISVLSIAPQGVKYQYFGFLFVLVFLELFPNQNQPPLRVGGSIPIPIFILFKKETFSRRKRGTLCFLHCPPPPCNQIKKKKRLFTRVDIDRTRGNGFNLRRGRFRLAIRGYGSANSVSGGDQEGGEGLKGCVTGWGHGGAERERPGGGRVVLGIPGAPQSP